MWTLNLDDRLHFPLKSMQKWSHLTNHHIQTSCVHVFLFGRLKIFFCSPCICLSTNFGRFSNVFTFIDPNSHSAVLLLFVLFICAFFWWFEQSFFLTTASLLHIFVCYSLLLLARQCSTSSVSIYGRNVNRGRLTIRFYSIPWACKHQELLL